MTKMPPEFEPQEVDAIIEACEEAGNYAASACIRWYCRELAARDRFIVEQGGWGEFVKVVSDI